MVCYLKYYLWEDDRPKTIPSFMSKIIDAGKEPEHKRSKLNNMEPFNWLPKLSFFGNDFFLTVTGLLILKDYSKDT